MLPSRTGPAGPAETGLQPAAVPGHERNVSAQSTIPESMSMPRVQGGAVVPPETQPMHPLFPDLESAQAAGFVAQLEGFVDSDDELEVGDDGEGFESYDEGEDEDSNDEGFYRNDYPEEELPDEDDELDLGVGGSDYYDEDDEEDDRYGECCISLNSIGETQGKADQGDSASVFMIQRISAFRCQLLKVDLCPKSRSMHFSYESIPPLLPSQLLIILCYSVLLAATKCQCLILSLRVPVRVLFVRLNLAAVVSGRRVSGTWSVNQPAPARALADGAIPPRSWEPG